MKKILLILVAAVFGLAGLAEATSFSYTTTSSDSGPGAGIVYDLNVSGTGPFNATFTVTETIGDVSPEWYIGWITFKFGMGAGDPANYSNLTTPSGTGPWSISDGDTNSTVKVLGGGGNYNQLRDDGSSGFYVTSLAEGATPNITEGLFLTGNAGNTIYEFTFDFTLVGEIRTDTVPFQLAYYDGLTGGQHPKVIVNQLSRDLSGGGGGGGGGKVPEPATMLLLGFGLAGMIPFVRSRFKR